jgi:hypothetical protein
VPHPANATSPGCSYWPHRGSRLLAHRVIAAQCKAERPVWWYGHLSCHDHLLLPALLHTHCPLASRR